MHGAWGSTGRGKTFIDLGFRIIETALNPSQISLCIFSKKKRATFGRANPAGSVFGGTTPPVRMPMVDTGSGEKIDVMSKLLEDRNPWLDTEGEENGGANP